MLKNDKITAKPMELNNIEVLTPELQELDMEFRRKHDLKNIKDIQNILQEHTIMKRFIIEKGLFEELLNYDNFLRYLREDYTGE